MKDQNQLINLQPDRAWLQIKKGLAWKNRPKRRSRSYLA